ncbi:hypothetical protein pb186bvf_001701 [Paramecium bursaria]
MLKEFILELGNTKTQEIPQYYKNQFKIKENFINPNSKHFESIAQKLLVEEKPGVKRKWDKQCKMLFIWILVKFFQMRNKRTINPNVEEWTYLAKTLNIEETTLKQRWITLINPMSKSVNWDPEEDDIIRNLMNEQDEKHIWTQIALELYNHNNGQFVRTPKQVRERWMNYLNPKLRKENWTHEEDMQLLQMVVTHGKRWSHISTLLKGRTENHVKNRFKSLIHKIYKEEDDDDIEEIQAIRDYLKKQNKEEKEDQQFENNQISLQQRKSLQRQAKSRLNQHNEEQQVKTKKKVKKEQVKEIPQEEIPQEQIQQQQVQQVQQVQQQVQNNNYCYSIQGNCDTRSLENRKDLSTPISLMSFYQQQEDAVKNEQYKQLLQQQQQQIKMTQQSPLYNTPRYDTMNQYKYPNNDLMTGDIIQQLLQKKNFQYQNNLISPFPQQTPMVYTPMYYMNPQYFTNSPLQMIRSPYNEVSPLLYNQWLQIQSPKLMEMDYKNEVIEPQCKLEFLQSSNLVDSWKEKRDKQKAKNEQ